MAAADPIFNDQRLADVYDPLDPDRSDLDVYASIVGELGARSVLDVGCGTGTFAVLLAAHGLDVVGVDPATASLAVARRKAGAERVRWVHGDAASVGGLGLAADVATMTGNVAQVFLGDDDWAAALEACRAALRPGGTLVFEVRDPSKRAWEGWVRERTHRVVDGLETWVDLLDVDLPFVSFRHTFRFPDGDLRTSDSTLRFRSREEVEASLADAGYAVADVRDAPDRPGLEHVFLATVEG